MDNSNPNSNSPIPDVPDWLDHNWFVHNCFDENCFDPYCVMSNNTNDKAYDTQICDVAVTQHDHTVPTTTDTTVEPFGAKLYILSLLAVMSDNVCSCSNNIKINPCIFCNHAVLPLGCACSSMPVVMCDFCDDKRRFLFDALNSSISGNYERMFSSKSADEVRNILYCYLDFIKSQVVGENFPYYDYIRDIMDKYVSYIV